MKIASITLAVALVGVSGCAIGLPHGELEPSVTADCVRRLHDDWGVGASHAARAASADAAMCDCETPAPAPAPVCEGDCFCCPIKSAGPPQPPYVDPGPPSRFYPVPVRPVFHPAPSMGGGYYAGHAGPVWEE